ncbi:MAG: RibD family protein [Candidatus Lambdaproteobacteria bacterium]|nr:RibD family protein [Candidatus Lambdaproteobacteria bacterium]
MAAERKRGGSRAGTVRTSPVRAGAGGSSPAPDPLRLEPARLAEVLANTNRPWVSLKAAVSLDGKLATARGESQWITGEVAREAGHRLRAAHAAVLVGRGTREADDPRLTVRLPGGDASGEGGAGRGASAQPARIVLDSGAVTPPEARCFAADGARRILIAADGAERGRVGRLRERGIEVIACRGPRPDPAEFLPLLRARGIETILVEGGAQVHAALIARAAADAVFLFLAGLVIGGSDAPGWCATLGIDRLADAPRLELAPPVACGPDLLLRGWFRRG